ncbi:MAG: nucleotidyltransferase domain-containing protein [Sporichthyaceae bacterium]
MSLVAEYQTARRGEEIARLRRAIVLRAMAATGMSQRQIAAALGVSQPAVSQQLKAAPDLAQVHPETLIEAASPILKEVAESRGFRDLAVFGSVARRSARKDSDIDLLIRVPRGTAISGMVELQDTFARILGRPIDLVSYGGLKSRIDDDVLREAVLL